MSLEGRPPDQIIPPSNRRGPTTWVKGMARVPGSGRRPGQLSRRKKLQDYIAMLESTCNLETADPGKFLLHIAATGRDPRFKGELRQDFKYVDEAHAMAAVHNAGKAEEKIDWPIPGRDYPIDMALRTSCAMKMVRHIYPVLGATKLTLEDSSEQNEHDDAATARQLSAVPEVRDALEAVALAMTKIEVNR